MAKCSQCGKEMSLFERDLLTGACRQCQRIGARPASLGCGTFILIAIIVGIVTNSSFDRIEKKLSAMERTIDALEVQVSQQSAEIRLLRTAIEESRSPQVVRPR